MFKQLRLKSALAFGLAAAFAAVTLAVASAAPSPNVSFSSSNDGASAGWAQGKGSAIDLTLGTSGGSFAVITLHHVDGMAVGSLSAPSFTTDNYNAGSPRYYITLSDGNTLWGYPSNAGLNGGTFAWAINNGNTYMSWDDVRTAEGEAIVTGAFVIADADQSAGTTDEITDLTFNGISFN